MAAIRDTAAAAAPATRKRRASGPRKPSSVHAIFHVTDDQGKTLPNAKVKIVHQSKSAEKALEFLDANQGKGYQRSKIIVQDTQSDPISDALASDLGSGEGDGDGDVD